MSVFPKQLLVKTWWNLRDYCWDWKNVMWNYKISCIKISIQFIKEGKVSKTAHRNRHKPTLLDGSKDWCIIANVDR